VPEDAKPKSKKKKARAAHVSADAMHQERPELFIARSEIELLHKTFLIWILTNLNPEPRRARRQAVGISKIIWKMNESCEMHSMAE